MPHILTLRMEQGQGIVPTLECTEPADASKSRCRQPYSETCSVVEVFEWDSAVSIEGYVGPKFDLSKIAIDVLAANEDEFEWQLAGEEIA